MLSARDLLVVLHFRILAFYTSWLRRVAIPRLLLEGGGLRLLFIAEEYLAYLLVRLDIQVTSARSKKSISFSSCRLVAGFRVVYAVIPTLFVVKAVSQIVKCKADDDNLVF